MKLGLVGKPNVGKSTFFAAATASEAQIGDYPFTTIDPNHGVAAVRVPDPGKDLGVASTPRTGRLVDGGATRLVPVELVDVAGLVPGAHEGKGLGNRFLSDLARADALIHVVDASGLTDAEGNPATGHDPLEDVRFLTDEIDAWIAGLLEDGWDRVARRVQQENRKLTLAIAEKLQGIGVGEAQAAAALRAVGLADKRPSDIDAEARRRLAAAVRAASKPILVAWNKADKVPKGRIEALASAVDGPSVPVAAQSELALEKGTSAGLLDYVPGAGSFGVKGELKPAQKQGLDYIQHHVLDVYGSTGVAAALEHAAFGMLGLLPVFPVEDETHYTDKDGRVLPDCHLVPAGTTARALAYRVHTDLGERFIRAIDCRTRRTIGADHELKAGDVVKIAANA